MFCFYAGLFFLAMLYIPIAYDIMSDESLCCRLFPFFVLI
jgi:hypothetical protein